MLGVLCCAGRVIPSATIDFGASNFICLESVFVEPSVGSKLAG